MPGNAVEAILGRFPNLQPSAYKAISAMLGVGKNKGSEVSQYFTYLNNVVHFNFGTDVAQYPASVSSLLDSEIPWTLVLVGTATVIAFFLGTALGIMAGWPHGGWLDRLLPPPTVLEGIPHFFPPLLPG